MSVKLGSGVLSFRRIAALVGVTTLNRDREAHRGKRRLYRGRTGVRSALYMAALSARRHKSMMMIRVNICRITSAITHKVTYNSCGDDSGRWHQ